MKIKTRDFGEAEVGSESVFHFAQPIYGFEDYRDYAVLHDPDFGEGIVWLQSIDEPGLCFILVNPDGLGMGYSPALPEEIQVLLGDGKMFCWVIAVIGGNVRESTVNLKSPVIMNPNSRLAAQVILESEYPVKYPLMKGGRG